MFFFTSKKKNKFFFYRNKKQVLSFTPVLESDFEGKASIGRPLYREAWASLTGDVIYSRNGQNEWRPEMDVHRNGLLSQQIEHKFANDFTFDLESTELPLVQN